MAENLALGSRMTELGYGPAQLARLLGISERAVGYWLSGEVTWPREPTRSRCLALLKVKHPRDLGFIRPVRRYLGRTDHERMDEMLRRDLLGVVAAVTFGAPVAELPLFDTAAPHRVGGSDIKRLAAVRRELKRLDHQIGGGVADGDGLTAMFTRASRLLGATFARDTVRVDLKRTIGHYGSTVGWMLVDQGRHQDARRIFARSLQVVSDTPQPWRARALILAGLARQAIQLEEYEQALGMLGFAQSESHELTPRMRSMLHVIQARAYAGLGNRAEVDRHVALAEEEYQPLNRAGASEDLNPEYDIPTWYDLAEVDGDAGHAYYALAVRNGIANDQAARRLECAVASYPDSERRSRALALVKLAKVRFVQDQPEEAVRVSGHALEAASTLDSSRVTDDLRSIRPLATPYAKTPAVRAMLADLPA